jgi:transposase
VLAAGGTVWCGDETTLREFPPLRAAWSRRGQQTRVIISGRNERRVVHGAINIRTGQQVQVVCTTQRGPDVAAFVVRLGQERQADQPLLLIWDNAPSHKTKPVQTALATAGIEVAWLPFRSPELNPCEDLWRHLKGVVAANRVYPVVQELADRAVAWLEGLTPACVLRYAGLTSSKFHWLPT